MKKLTFMLGVICAGFIATSVQAEEPDIIGVGNTECATLIDDNLFDAGSNPMQWYFGYVGGISAAAYILASNDNLPPPPMIANLNMTPTDTLIDMLQNVCVSQPDIYLYEAANIILGTLNE